MMLSDWQINFNNTGLDIMDDAYTLQRLVRFMTVQEATFNAIQEHKQNATALPACCSPAHLGGGCVTFQQGCHGKDFVPMSFALAKAIHGQESSRNMLVLFDLGSMSTWISSNKLPEGTKGNKVPPLIGMTIAGQCNSNKTVELTNLCFPEFYRTRYFSSYKARVFETSCRYDMIIGRNML
jgi:hypothetical protein